MGQPSAEDKHARLLDLLIGIGTRALGQTETEVFLAETAREACRLLSLPRCAIRLDGDPATAVEHVEPRSGPPSPDPDALDPRAEDGPPGSIIRVPLEVQDDAGGTLLFDLGVGKAAGGDDFVGARAVAGQIAIALRHLRLLRGQRDLADRLASLVHNVPGLVYQDRPDGSVAFMSAGAERLTGFPARDFLEGRVAWRDLIHPEDRAEALGAVRRAVRAGEAELRIEYRIRSKDGDVRWIADRRRLVYAPDGRLRHADGLALDVTDRRRAREESRQLQAQLLLAKKIEAVAGLAGGIAHDFNNLLTSVLGYANLLLHASPPNSEAWTAARAIQAAADRASQLTSQLLGFARRGKNLDVPVDLKRTVEAVVKALAEVTNGRISVVTRFHEGSAAVMGDPHQLEGAVGNLAANAIDAMPAGGTLTVATEDAELDDAFCRTHPGASPGRYVLLTVSDTGVGIPRENLGRVFDPFFTTKERGTGTGLGLSMVYGIVKSHGGYIEVESEPGAGTTLLVFLPRGAVDALQLEIPFSPAPGGGAARGKGVVLLVDDQELVREVCSAMLRILGYEVVTASDGAEALERYRGSWRDIDLVILDMVMPNVDGPACFRGMKAINPGVRAVLASGYSLEGSVQEVLDEGVAGFIQKPFRMEQLSSVVARVLGRPC